MNIYFFSMKKYGKKTMSKNKQEKAKISFIKKEYERNQQHDMKPLDYGIFVRIFSYSKPYAVKRT